MVASTGGTSPGVSSVWIMLRARNRASPRAPVTGDLGLVQFQVQSSVTLSRFMIRSWLRRSRQR